MPSDPTLIGNPGAGSGTPPSDDGTGGATPASNPGPSPTRQENGLAELISGFRAELVDMRREFRNRLRTDPAPAPTNQPAPNGTAPPVPAPQWDSNAILAFRDAIEESGVTVTVPQRKILERLYRAESGVADPVSWVREQSEHFGWRKPLAVNPAAPVPAPVVAAPTGKPPNLPPPMGTAAGGNQLPEDQSLLTTAQIDAMTPAQAREFYERWKTRSGTFRHPWAGARDSAMTTSRDAEIAADALRRVMAKK